MQSAHAPAQRSVGRVLTARSAEPKLYGVPAASAGTCPALPLVPGAAMPVQWELP